MLQKSAAMIYNFFNCHKLKRMLQNYCDLIKDGYAQVQVSKCILTVWVSTSTAGTEILSRFVPLPGYNQNRRGVIVSVKTLYKLQK